MTMMDKLNAMRAHGGAAHTHGLDDATIASFAANDGSLRPLSGRGRAATRAAPASR